VSHILSHGSVTEDRLLDELADECRRYLTLLETLGNSPKSERREDLEGELYASISHLAGHGGLLLEHLDDLLDELPEDPEETIA
jgi:hypothetical protein